ncbi:hypothetical protein IMCC3317_29460 [Kordia antarctica]|uniref:Uncharacterized protein n=1 Tax=Kordia antarctica TaxID=1218801 RepID=A0A7L4ZMY4_9FLAO|nr:hypothetical protein IMCC3317_29460 [Kordia antarctica]
MKLFINIVNMWAYQVRYIFILTKPIFLQASLGESKE